MTSERGFSGGEVQVFLLIEELGRRGHRNVLLCPAGSASETRARERNIATRTVPRSSEWWPCNVWAVRRVLGSVGPDLVHLHTGRANWLGGLAAYSLGVPAVTTRRMDRRVRRGPRTSLLYGRLVARAVAISPAVARRLLAAGISPSIVRTIPSAVDPDALRASSPPGALRAAEGLEPGTPLLLVTARLVRRKGIDILLEALAMLQGRGLEPMLWVAGEGPEREVLERLASERRIAGRVRFLGRRTDVPDLLAACDVFVLPSRHEGLGVAALEAMAAARPIVASGVGGLGEVVVHERTGLLVPPNDAAALAAALERMLRDPQLRKRLGAEGPARVAEGHRAEQMADAYERLYFDLLAEWDRG